MDTKELFILKLGGSLLTDKSQPNSIRKDSLKQVVQQIIDAHERLIVIHGGGSFGHPLAKKYHISNGLNKTIPKQILGLTETHQAMNKFNSFIINAFLEKSYPTLSIQTSSLFIQESQKILTHSMDIIETALDLNILPILYGDIILDKSGSFSIISGDQIIFQLCKHLDKYHISKIIFAMEVDGIYLDERDGNGKYRLAQDIYANELNNLKLADLGQKIDVTGGIKGKIESIKKILTYNIPIQLINGLKKGYILKALKNQPLNCTNILTRK
jgi:isopentenyl phosphate kinase